MAVVMPPGRQAYYKTDGTPLVGGRLRTFAAGTTTPKATWSDAAGTIANPNPVILDARGEATIYWSGAYKVQLEDSAGAIIWTVDNYVAPDATVSDGVSTVPSATTVDLSVTTTRTVALSGSNTINSFGPAPAVGQWRFLRFDGAITINGGSGITLPNGVNSLVTAVGDWAIFQYYSSSWRCVTYRRVTDILVDGSGNATVPGTLTIGTDVVAPQPSFRNRLHNADFQVDQVGSVGASWSNVNGRLFDRWRVSQQSTVGVSVTWTRNLRTTPFASIPAVRGYGALGMTSTPSSPTVSASHLNALIQRIEGINVADLAWGTFSAQPVTVSFWLFTNVPVGTLLPVAIRNGAGNRSYVTTITTQALTTRYSVTIPGDTSGTWATDNTTGLELVLDIGSGSNLNASAANTWTASAATRVSSAYSFIASEAYFTLAGAQLEAGSVATTFEQRPYPVELALCQRYFSSFASLIVSGHGAAASSAIYADFIHPASMRATPNAVFSNVSSSNAATNPSINYGDNVHSRVSFLTNAAGSAFFIFNLTLSAEL